MSDWCLIVGWISAWMSAVLWLRVLVPSFLQATGMSCTAHAHRKTNYHIHRETHTNVTYIHFDRTHHMCTQHSPTLTHHTGTAMGEIPLYWLTRAARETGDSIEVMLISYIHTILYTHIRTYTHICLRFVRHITVYVCVCTCVCCVYHLCASICVLLCIYVCLCVW